MGRVRGGCGEGMRRVWGGYEEGVGRARGYCWLTLMLLKTCCVSSPIFRDGGGPSGPFAMGKARFGLRVTVIVLIYPGFACEVLASNIEGIGNMLS